MVTRLRRPLRWPELPDHPGQPLLDSAHRLLAWRPADPLLLLWRIVWLPFWIGGDIPTPWLPVREPRLTPAAPAAQGAARAIDRIGRRIWINWLIACVTRGLWLPFVVASATGLVHLVRGTPFAPEKLIWLWFITLPLGLLFGLLLRPGRRRVAWMLDHTFTLHDRMTTAVEALETEAPVPGERASMAYLQLADTANVAIGLRGDPRFRVHLPAREISLAILSGLLLASLLFLRGVGGDIPDPVRPSVPIFVPAAERRTAAEAPQPRQPDAERPPTVEEVQQRSEVSNATREDLNAIADALDQNALTAPAADALRNGDYAQAAQLIRDAAGQMSELSPDARALLADALDQAAASIRATSPSLADAAGRAASSLRSSDEAARTGMRDLGDAVDLAGDAVIPQAELAAQLQAAQQAAQNQRPADAASYQQRGGDQGSQSQPQSGAVGNPGETREGTGLSNADGVDAQPGFAQDENSQQSSSFPADQSAGQNPDGGAVIPGAEIGGGAADQPDSGSGDAEGTGGSDQTAPGGESADSGESLPTGQNVSGQPGGVGTGGESLPSDEQAADQRPGGAGQSDQTLVPTPVPTQISRTTTAAGAGPTVQPDDAVNLPGQNQGGETIALGGNQGSSSWANGAGVTEARGSATQNPVPTAGADSNRVPPDYRQVVENYFSQRTP